jgi:hypothetical protein
MAMPRHPLELALKTPHWSLRSAFRMRDNLFAAMPQEIDRIRGRRTGQRIPPRKITSETALYRFPGFLLLALRFHAGLLLELLEFLVSRLGFFLAQYLGFRIG